MRKISEFGCIVCYNNGVTNRAPACVHHILNAAKRRIGHLDTIPLCDTHHKNGVNGHTSRHPFKAEFERRYGTEAELLKQVRELVNV